MRKADILGALIKDIGLKGDDVGKIDLHDHMAYVGLKAERLEMALSRFKTCTIKGKRRRVSEV